MKSEAELDRVKEKEEMKKEKVVESKVEITEKKI